MLFQRPRNMLEPRRAQAVIELAVFGSIVLYLIGLIIAQGASATYQQESQLQAMRLALLTSYQSALAGQARRNTSSFLLLEDRLATGGGRYGVTDRQPFVAMGGGTMSMHLYKPCDWSDIADQSEIPVQDVRINGQMFNLKLARATRYRVRYFQVTLNGGINPNASYVTISQMHSCAGGAYCVPNTSCETVLEDSRTVAPAAGIDYNRDAKRLLLEWVKYPMGGYPPAYFSVVKNDDANFLLPTSCTPATGSANFQILRRFDLNRDGKFPDMCCPNPLAYVLWQWKWKSLSDVAGEVDAENGVYPNYDVDGDLFEETIYGVSTWTAPAACSANTTVSGYDVAVLDWDRGDVNSNVNVHEYIKDDQPGLKNDLRITTYQGAGTYMQLKEEANTAGTMGRSTSTVKKSQEDLVERKYVLNDRMLGGGSLCEASTESPLQSGVQACCNTVNCCGSGARAGVTCFEHPPGGIKKLFIRSHIPDQRGRLWATDVTPSN